MKAFLTTVAGTSSRFNASLEAPCLKCIYYEHNPEHTLLFRLLKQTEAYDRLFLVGGYQYDALERYVGTYLPQALSEKVTLIRNPRYEDAGSGWSLYLGLQTIETTAPGTDEILFAEGDLFVDEESFRAVALQKGDVITVNHGEIRADKSVALYDTLQRVPRYIYDTGHGALQIDEPFRAIYNSSQIWKFASPTRLFERMKNLTEDVHAGTNLALINAYFSEAEGEIHCLWIKEWVNCNTLEDYRGLHF